MTVFARKLPVVFLVVVVVLSAWTTPARAHPIAPVKIPLSITVGGGVSLGAYQAGVLYYLSEAAKKNTSALDLKLVSGASAGTINALLAVLAACTDSQADPENNLFWNIWHNVGFDQLFVGAQHRQATAALSNAALINVAERLRTYWDRGISTHCDVMFAVTATRVRDTPAITTGSLRALRLEERFVLHIKGRGPGIAPHIENYPDPTALVDQPLLALPRDQSTAAGITEAFDRLKELLLASSAFPLAFPAVPVKLCMLEPGKPMAVDGRTECGDQEREVPFMDGGVYDNTPLRLAYRTARRIQPAGTRWLWQERSEPVDESAAPPEAMVFTLIDKDNQGYPDVPDDYDERKPDAPRTLLSYLGAFAEGFVATTLGKEITALYEENPRFAPRVLPTVRHYPTASGHLANFFGFFEHELRRFDFYLGMYDASRMVAAQPDKLIQTSDANRLAPAQPAASESAPFRCMAAVYADQPLPQEACRAPDLDTFRILLQVSLDRLYSRCDRLKGDPTAQKTRHALCQHAMHLGPDDKRRLVEGIPHARFARWREGRGESSMAHMMRLLSHYKFPFRDLGLDGEHAGSAMAIIRHRLGHALEALSARQSTSERALLSVSGKIALNLFLHYSPPFAIVYATLGRGYELGTSLVIARMADPVSLRWNFALEGKGIESLVDSATHHGAVALSFGLVTGPELELYGDAIAQVRLGVRGGVQLSTRGWGTAEDFARSSAGGHAGLVQVVPSLALFERLRLQMVYEQLLPTKATETPGWDLLFGVGGQFLSPFY